jgi:uroporphyrinogen decarboxylase
VPLPINHPLVSGVTTDSALVKAYSGVKQESPPVWFMRQAGRSLPEYKKIREKISMLDACLSPEVAAEITLQPVRRHKVDAAIFFSDIVIPLKLAQVDVEIVSGIGPVIASPVQDFNSAKNLMDPEQIDFSKISEAVNITSSELNNIPLIAFCGAPFTVASYLIEGGPSKSLPVTRSIMLNDPKAWDQIMTWVARISAKFLQAQVHAGASALQVFDSWAGKLSKNEYETYAAPYTKKLFKEVTDLPVAKVHFGLGTKDILTQMHEVGPSVMGIDYHTPLDYAINILGPLVPLQGNIDPNKLLGPYQELIEHVEEIIEKGRAARSHVLNLGHGVIPDTNPDVITKLVEYIHEK